MPIYHKTPPSKIGNPNTAEIDYHTSEAAKVKRTREQAYFNSYDFDAIEVLPYDDEEDDDDNNIKSHRSERARRGTGEAGGSVALPDGKAMSSQTKQQLKLTQQQQQQQQQHQRHPSARQQHMIDKHATHSHPHSHVKSQNPAQSQPLRRPLTNKYNPSLYLRRITGIFNQKSAITKHVQHHQLHDGAAKKGNTALSISEADNEDDDVVNIDEAAAAAAVTGHEHNTHPKLSSSETTSTSLSSSSIAEGAVLTLANNTGSMVVGSGSGGIDAVPVNGSGHTANSTTRDVSLDCVVDVVGTNTRTTSDKIVGNHSVAATSSSAASGHIAVTANGNGNGNSNSNFLLPRAILKYQSSTASTPGAAGITAANTNSMPLATNTNGSSHSHSNTIANNNNNNNNNNNSSGNSSGNSNQQQQQQQQSRDAHKLDLITSKTTTTSGSAGVTNPAIRVKKISNNSSIITSLASDELDEDHHPQNGQNKTEDTLMPKTINPKSTVRASSHQSHYSTDKSASSGYYSSNVCSTYSLEEHIYSEPTIDLKKLQHPSAEHANGKIAPLPLPLSPSSSSSSAVVAATTSLATAATLHTNNKLQQLQQLPTATETNNAMRTLDYSRRYRSTENDLSLSKLSQTLPAKRNSRHFNDNLKILESSIENLDRHLKSFPGVSAQESLENYTQSPYNAYGPINANDKIRGSYHQLPTIQEGFDAVKKQTWQEDRSDDSLMDIDFDSFLLDKDKKLAKAEEALNAKGLDNPTFLTEEQEENHYKCAKYINSCPEDAYRVESDILAPTRSSISGQSVAVSMDLYPKRYEQQLHFESTRELLEDVRDKIRLLTQTQSNDHVSKNQDDRIPKELHTMINTLSHELELYLQRMNQHSELEIRQLCTGLVKNQHIVKMKNAFERRRSLTETPDIYSTYEAIQDGIFMNGTGVPISIRQQITSIRCASDPNFKMKRKSITEVFPLAECYVESIRNDRPATLHHIKNDNTMPGPQTETSQLQRNLSYHKPVLEQLNSPNSSTNLKGNKSSSKGSGNTNEPTDKDTILDWHRKKPSIWEMYYGTNRIQQSLLGGKKNGMLVTTSIASSPSTMCYPSSRPESDFTLDMPRAEQLRIKMEKEKKFRQRCRVITTFLSIVFFLLTVMVVSLVLTRGKRMFGSMI